MVKYCAGFMKIFIRNHRNNLIKNREQSFFYRAHSGHSMGHFWLIHLPVDLFHHTLFLWDINEQKNCQSF